MGQQTINTLKSWFVRGATPLAAQFTDLIDSFRHKDDAVEIADVTGLDEILDAATTSDQFNNHLSDNEAHNIPSQIITALENAETIGSESTVINIGNAGASVNIFGSVSYEEVTNKQISDKLITFNKGGAAGSAAGSGFELEENALITGFFKTSSARTGFELKAPAVEYKATLLLSSLTADRILTLPDLAGTILTYDSNGRSLVPAKLLVGNTDASLLNNETSVTVGIGADKTTKCQTWYNSGFGTPLMRLKNDGTLQVAYMIEDSGGTKILDVANRLFYNSAGADKLALNDALIVGKWGVLNGDFFLSNTSYGYYIGDTGTNDSWRIRLNGNNLVFERQESNSWVQKGIFNA